MSKWVLLGVLATLASLGGCPSAPQTTDQNAQDNSNSTDNGTPPTDGPSAPSRVVPMDEATAPSIELKWYPVGGATFYSIYAGTAADPPFVFNQTGNSYKLENAAPCATYYWRVEAHNDGGVTSSPAWSFKTICPTDRPDSPAYPSPPNQAYGITVKSSTNRGPVLNWQPASKTELYDVYFGETSNPAYLASSNEPSLKILPALAEGRQYYWRVVAKNKAGNSSSEEWSFVTTRKAGGPQTALANFPGDGAIDMPTRVRLQWTQSRDAAAYDVYFGEGSDPPKLATVASNNFTPGGDLALGKQYSWRIVAVGPTGSTSSPVWSFTSSSTPRPPLSPHDPLPSMSTNGVGTAARLEWTPMADATAYDVYVGAGGPPELVTRVTDAFYQPADLMVANTLYFWQIVALNDNGQAPGPVWNFVTGDTPDGEDEDGDQDSGDAGDGSGDRFGAGHRCDDVIQRINLTTSGGQTTMAARWPVPSTDGQVIAFLSPSGELVPGDTNQKRDIFVADRAAGTITRVSVDSSGGQGTGDCFYPAISGDGRYVAFQSTSALSSGANNGGWKIFVHDRAAHTTTCVSCGHGGDATEPSLSDDGRYVAYRGGGIVVYDTVTGSSDNVGGGEWPSISGDGRYVAAQVGSRIVVYDRQSHSSTTVSPSGNYSMYPAIASSGNRVAYAMRESTNKNILGFAYNIYASDVSGGGTVLASPDADGTPSGGWSWQPWMSADGRFVSYTGSNITGEPLNHHWHALRFEVDGGGLTLIDEGLSGADADADAILCKISGDGKVLTFDSKATNLVADDSNGRRDVFVVERCD